MEHVLSDDLAFYIRSLKDERGLQPSSIKLYEFELYKLLKLLPSPSTDLLRNHLKKLSPPTQWRKLIIWRSFLRAQKAPWKDLLEEFKVPKIRSKQPTFLTDQEAFQLEAVCYKTNQMARNRLFVALALQLGLRLSEILQLKFKDAEEGWLKILRKGGKEQRLPLTAGVQTLIHFWKAESNASDEDWLFRGRGAEPLSSRSAQLLLKDLAKLAGIQKRISPHSLRHTFATTLASRGANLAALKELLGHEQISTTERYLHVTPTHLRETLSLLQPKSLRDVVH
ncbi:MAG: site-specific tyrosine recombinase XerD [Bacteriovoracaceae bacterium]|nr:site-specific tyrosine recombinase XerD [Bacteriovoracaceae bacterium]